MEHQPSLIPLGSLWLSALVALLPLVVVFFLLGVLRMKAHWAGLIGVLASLGVAVFVFQMPTPMALMAALEGGTFGLFPITWIVLCAIFLFELTVASGHHDDLMKAFNVISPDPRVLGVFIAFGFCALLESLAGFGAPVAICGVMLVAVGFKPWKAALTVLVGNTFAVPYGAMATPLLTGANLTNMPAEQLSFIVSRQTGLMAWVVPLVLLVIMDGFKGLKEVWPLALAVGLGYSAAVMGAAAVFSPGLVNMVAALVSLAVGVLVVRIWKPDGSSAAAVRLTGKEAPHEPEKVSGAKTLAALYPYALIVVVFVVTQLVAPIKTALASTDIKVLWPFLWQDNYRNMVFNSLGRTVPSTVYNFQWLSSPGTLLFLTAIVIGLSFRMSPVAIGKVFATQVYKLRWTFLTIASVLALAYVMNLSGQTETIGNWIAGAGIVFPFLSPVLGWLGTAVTGSGTSTTALFSNLQYTAGSQIGVNPALMVATNTVGGAVGKMISPQTLAIATGGVDMVGEESVLLRKSLPWAVGLLVVLCLLAGLQALPVLGWMIPSLG
ncbi:L-lactate permease [Mobiluncus mulieris]|uniref:L-lactate permease n=1 Tax=Mobiluncus mulieris TaxID=2052 RepID=UPI0014704A5F|nr:L-lactate permease [Mobiluncus mulieris]NMX12085.1 L-lactate permease [Mobiluncus mulieris]